MDQLTDYEKYVLNCYIDKFVKKKKERKNELKVRRFMNQMKDDSLESLSARGKSGFRILINKSPNDADRASTQYQLQDHIGSHYSNEVDLKSANFNYKSIGQKLS